MGASGQGDRRLPALWLDGGSLDYPAAYELQQQLNAARHDGALPDTIVVVEHPSCLTVGRGGTGDDVLTDRATLARLGITVHESDRGGAVTYHGPGQLVCYPILDLNRHGRDVHLHARRLEEVMLRTAAACGVAAWRRPGYPGAWTASGKLGSLGVAVRRWVTLHGFAVNVCPDLDHFAHIVPCGLRDVAITSLERCMGREVSLAAVVAVVRAACAEVFGLALADATIADLGSSVGLPAAAVPASGTAALVGDDARRRVA